jgi:hypothetical protein
MGETAASGISGSEGDADVVQVSAPPNIGSIVHRALPMINISTGTVSSCLHRARQSSWYLQARSETFGTTCLPSIGNAIVVGDDA